MTSNQEGSGSQEPDDVFTQEDLDFAAGEDTIDPTNSLFPLSTPYRGHPSLEYPVENTDLSMAITDLYPELGNVSFNLHGPTTAATDQTPSGNHNSVLDPTLTPSTHNSIGAGINTSGSIYPELLARANHQASTLSRFDFLPNASTLDALGAVTPLQERSGSRDVNLRGFAAEPSLNVVNDASLPAAFSSLPACQPQSLLPLDSALIEPDFFEGGSLLDLTTAMTFPATGLSFDQADPPFAGAELMPSSASFLDFDPLVQMQLSQNPMDFAGLPGTLLEPQDSLLTPQAPIMVRNRSREVGLRTTQMPFLYISEQAPLLAPHAILDLSVSNQSSSARSKRIRSPSPEDATVDCLQFSLYNPHQKKAKRSSYSKKTCLRCQDQRKKCSGTFPCSRCTEFLERSLNAKKKRKETAVLSWTACFDSDIREMNIFGTFFDDGVLPLAARGWSTHPESSVDKDFRDTGRLVIIPPAASLQSSGSQSHTPSRIMRGDDDMIYLDSGDYFILPWMFTTLQLYTSPGRDQQVCSLEDRHASAKLMFDKMSFLLTKIKSGQTEYYLKALYLCLTVVSVVASKTTIWQRLGFNSTPELNNSLRERYESKEAHFEMYVKYLKASLSVFQDGDRQWPWIAQSIHMLGSSGSGQGGYRPRDTSAIRTNATLAFQYKGYRPPNRSPGNRYIREATSFGWQVNIPWGGIAQWEDVLPIGIQGAPKRRPRRSIYFDGEFPALMALSHQRARHGRLRPVFRNIWNLTPRALVETDRPTVTCDRCNEFFTAKGGYHCYFCHDGDYDVCEDCFAAGLSCEEDSHALQRWQVGHRSVMFDGESRVFIYRDESNGHTKR